MNPLILRSWYRLTFRRVIGFYGKLQTGEVRPVRWRLGGLFIAAVLGTWVLGTWGSVAGCGGAVEPQTTIPSPSSSEDKVALLSPAATAPKFRFRGVDGREISSEGGLGRNTVIAFVAAFDWASQAQARFLSGIARNHRPRTNCYVVVLERPEHAELVEAFVNTLSLPYPVAHVPSERLVKTDCRDVRTVPSVLVLDSGGYVVWKSRGLATEEVLNEVLLAAEDETKAPSGQPVR